MTQDGIITVHLFTDMSIDWMLYMYEAERGLYTHMNADGEILGYVWHTSVSK